MSFDGMPRRFRLAAAEDDVSACFSGIRRLCAAMTASRSLTAPVLSYETATRAPGQRGDDAFVARTAISAAKSAVLVRAAMKRAGAQARGLVIITTFAVSCVAISPASFRPTAPATHTHMLKLDHHDASRLPTPVYFRPYKRSTAIIYQLDYHAEDASAFER